jgi:hypothetical protein
LIAQLRSAAPATLMLPSIGAGSTDPAPVVNSSVPAAATKWGWQVQNAA